jgi:Ca2+-binding RTX toxin-like protein
MERPRLHHLLKKSRWVGKKIDHGRFLPRVEPLDERLLPAITASFSAAAGELRVVGDDQDNTIVVSRTTAGTILVNGGAVAIQGDPGANVANTHTIMMNGVGGNDNLSLDEANGAMPAASIFGGDGNDTLIGGSGNDFIDGGKGNDLVCLGAGDDTFQWNPGDGSDTVEGQGGRDTMVLNGSDVAEKFDISANGSRVRLTRDVGGVAMDLNGIEEIDLNALGGADTITVNDTFATDLVELNLDLTGSTGRGDGQTDTVILNGTEGDDHARIAAFDNGARIGAVVGVAPLVNITGAEATNDVLTVNALGGNDTVDASLLSANLIGLSLNGGAGNDTIVGSPGGDLINGGPGDDVVQMGAGNDTFVCNPGDGNDTVDGQGGKDTMVLNGSDAAEQIDISANGSRVQLNSDVDSVHMNLGGVETVELNALGGADTITVNDTSATDLAVVNVNLNSSAGTGDGQPDAVLVNGTNQDDTVQILPFAFEARVAVLGLVPQVNIAGSDGTTDHLTVNTLGGQDTVDSSGLPANLIGLTVDLGDEQGAATTTSLSPSANPAVSGQTVTFMITVTAVAPRAGTPTGMVTLLDGGTVLGTADLDADGRATLTTSFAATGSHVITAVYNGDGNFVGSSQDVEEQVSAPPPHVVEIQVKRVKHRTRVDVAVDHVLRRRFFPFGAFTGHVQILQADVNGDGLLDVIAHATIHGKKRTRTFLT